MNEALNTETMKSGKFYVLQNSFGNIAVQDYFSTEAEAEKEILRLEGFFPNEDFFIEFSIGEPVTVNV